MPNNQLIVINSGSSSIKFAAYQFVATLPLSIHGSVENIETTPTLTIHDANNKIVKEETFPAGSDYEFFYQWLIKAFESSQFNFTVSAVGHRVVHGGELYSAPIVVTDSILQQLKEYIPFARLHQPYNLEAIECIQKAYPHIPQVACFDTAFHCTHPKVANQFALPKAITEKGVKRYGFHGLSYEYITYQLNQVYKNHIPKRVVVAHLGNGASLCAIKDGKSIDSTMGLTALDGLMMGTRCGSLDPGVILYLLQYKKMSPDEIEGMLYKQSGLLGVSGISNNMKTLLSDHSLSTQEAIELYVYRIRHDLGAMIGVLGGLDLLVFTAGIGENANLIREKVCADQEWLGLVFNSESNNSHQQIISDAKSRVEVRVIPTNEEWMIAHHAYCLIQNDNQIKKE